MKTLYDIGDPPPLGEVLTACPRAGTCEVACTEQGIRNAIATGGGSHTFDCNGPTTVATEAEIVLGNDVIFDGEGKLTVDGNTFHRVFSAPDGPRKPG